MCVCAAASDDDGGERLGGDIGGSVGVFAALVSLEVEGLPERERAVPAVQLARLVDRSQVSVEAPLLRERLFASRAIQSFQFSRRRALTIAIININVNRWDGVRVRRVHVARQRAALEETLAALRAVAHSARGRRALALHEHPPCFRYSRYSRYSRYTRNSRYSGYAG